MCFCTKYCNKIFIYVNIILKGGDHRACFKEALAAVTFPASLKSLTQFTPDYKTLYESSEGKTYGLELEAGYWLC